MRKFLMTLIICVMCVTPVFADVDSDLESAMSDINDHLKQTVKETAIQAYPIGSVYTTVEDIDVDDMVGKFGGEWREITETMLWATDASQIDEDEDGFDDNAGDVIDQRHIMLGVGGQTEYTLTAGIGSDGVGYSFWTDDNAEYLNNSAKTLIAMSYTSGDVANSVLVVDDNDIVKTTIMPPYTKVRMFERIG